MGRCVVYGCIYNLKGRRFRLSPLDYPLFDSKEPTNCEIPPICRLCVYVSGSLTICCFIRYIVNYSAFLGQTFSHSKHKIHSVPFLRFLELSVTSTFIGQTFLHFPQETHLLLSHLIRSNEK